MLPSPSRPRRIVIVGGGFAGLLTARRIASSHGRFVEVTLVSANDRFIFSPWLIDALATPEDISHKCTVSLPELATRFGFTFVKGLASHVERTNRILSVATDDAIVPYPYDLLVLAQGAVTAYYGIPGAEEYTLPLKTWDDVAHIQTRVRECVARARSVQTDEERRAALSFVCIGGGPSGIESAFALKEYLESQVGSDDALRSHVSYTLLEAMPRVLNGFPENMAHGALDELATNGFIVHTEAGVAKIERDAIELKTTERIPFALALWTAGVAANPIAITPEVERDGKGMLIDDSLKIDDYIFGIGDAVRARDPKHSLPKTAQAAMQMAEALSKNVRRQIDGQPPLPIRLHNVGSIITLGSTGYLNVGSLAIKFPLALQLRDLFYRYRMHQLRG